MVYSKSFRVSRADKFMNFVIWVATGPFILFATIFVDTYYFVQHLLIRDLYKTKFNTGDKSISKDSLRMIETYFKKNNERLMPFK